MGITKTLHEYQAEKIASAEKHLRAGKDVMIVEPTGGGKTLQGMVLLGRLIGDGFTHAIAAAPQRQIEQGFLLDDNLIVNWTKPKRRTKLTPKLIRAARGKCETSSRRILAYLQSPDPGYALVCTHASLTYLFTHHIADLVSLDFSSKLLVIDEAHHRSAKGLSNVTSVWSKNGGVLLGLTATPMRADRKEVIHEGMEPLIRTLAQHMSEGFCPGRIDYGIVPFGEKGDNVTEGQMTGQAMTKVKARRDELVRKIVAKWLADGEQKTIVRVPPIIGGSASLVRALVKALEKKGARVLDATGEEEADKRRFIAALNSERGRSYAESQYDVMIGIQRVLEGTDWPVCSAVYVVGVPSSMTMIIQLIGRAMRQKGMDHPYADVATFAFFVPTAGGEALDNLPLQHSRNALLLSAYLADHKTGEEWLVVGSLKRALEGIGADQDTIDRIETVAKVSLEALAEIKLVFAAELEKNPETTIGELAEAAIQKLPNVSKADINAVLVRILMVDPNTKNAPSRPDLEDQFAMCMKIAPDVVKAKGEAFARIVEEFRSETLAPPNSLEAFAAQVHRMTGRTLSDFRDRLCASESLSVERVKEAIRFHLKQTGKLPTCGSGFCVLLNLYWSSIDSCGRQGVGGLQVGQTLTWFKRQFFGSKRGAKLSVDLVRQEMAKYLSKHGELPTYLSGYCEGLECDWRLVQARGKNGTCGLEEGQTLSWFAEQFFADHRKKAKNGSSTYDATECQRSIFTYSNQSKRVPVMTCGPMPGLPGKSFRGLHSACRRGAFGAEIRSLDSFIRKFCPEIFEVQPASGVNRPVGKNRPKAS